MKMITRKTALTALRALNLIRRNASTMKEANDIDDAIAELERVT